jgi:hypothetical protein
LSAHTEPKPVATAMTLEPPIRNSPSGSSRRTLPIVLHATHVEPKSRASVSVGQNGPAAAQIARASAPGRCESGRTSRRPLPTARPPTVMVYAQEPPRGSVKRTV